jgi:hypothetical protein
VQRTLTCTAIREAHAGSQNGNCEGGKLLAHARQEISGIDSLSLVQNYFHLGGDPSLAVETDVRAQPVTVEKLH